MPLLRFTTAGSVDDGKSTLIGRLLFDSKSIFEDQLDAIALASKRRGESQINLSLLTDGLRAEREQGITIDVAYRYFSTPRRKFIIADTPGHFQYTRNMVTGASTAHLALILVDARNGIVEQTIRHTFIASLLGIRHILVCINKMDLVNFEEGVYLKILSSFQKINGRLGLTNVQFIPISALQGDNIVEKSARMPWYTGKTLLETLEETPAENTTSAKGRFPVQYVIRPDQQKFPDFRGYAGRVAGGVFYRNQKVIALPSGMKASIQSVIKGTEELETVPNGSSVTISLDKDIDIGRGSLIVPEKEIPRSASSLQAMICWFSQIPMHPNGKYLLMHVTGTYKCRIEEIFFISDMNTLNEMPGRPLEMNDIGKVRLKLSKPVFFDLYKENRTTGSFILVDETTNATIAAGMIEG
ncbi:MAG: sulfate adenylyltransferase [Bacteroidales bacterium]|nr:sulfate adenylyltransferase [Bacteroidales bacterium]